MNTESADLVVLIEFLGTDSLFPSLADYLCAHSALPGPRGNLELAYAWADVCGQAEPALAERLRLACQQWLALSAEQAPVNDPAEFLPFCGALGLGALAATEPAWRLETLAALRQAADDPRWRLREGVAMGLQRLIAASPQATLDALKAWLAAAEPLVWRAVAAAVAEPSLLADATVAERALALHKGLLDGLSRLPDRRGDAFRSLRQGLGYSVSVVVAARPVEGFPWLRELAASADADVRWIVRENLKKKRLTRPFVEQAAGVAALLAAGD